MPDEIQKMLQDLETAVLSPEVLNRAAQGKALQSVAQSSAVAVQDAVDNLRNISTISTTAVGTAMAKYLETQLPMYLDVIAQAQGLVTTASEQLEAIGLAASQVLAHFEVT